MSFTSKIVLVAGATGNVGSGAVRAFLDHGAKVIALSRRQDSLNTLANTLKAYGTPIDNLIPFVADVGNDADLAKLSQAIKDKKIPEIDHVVSSSGPYWNTPPLYELDFQKFREIMNANFESHFLIYRNFLPFIINKPGSSYTIVSGAAGDSGSGGPTGVAQNGIFGISKVAFLETKDKPVRVNRLHMAIRVESDTVFEKMVKEGQISPEKKTQTSAKRFGVVFAAIAKAADLKGQVINVSNIDEVEELTKKYL
eukprot:TRINITY_DN9698_c0_g1_i1.p1 TRINITY_DN9698_c0_g1~~TRINITY_DN9698_c0_g1_i1.p1  ORF type:complete len:281 (-),score=50.43 TRINITY_DN9698_c0_g1_i1:80-841(-)